MLRYDQHRLNFEAARKLILDEREYQLRRWGVRQADGTFQHWHKSAYGYGALLLHYVNIGATACAQDDTPTIMTVVRKLAAILLAVNEASGSALKYVFEQAESSALSNFRYATADWAIMTVHDFIANRLLGYGFNECFMCLAQYHANCPLRDLQEPIINRRDSKPA